MKYTKHTLRNGLRVLLVPMKEAQTVTVLILTGTGSRYETKETNGLSHFLEHMFFKGTPKRPTALAIAEELDAIGGAYNAYTSKDRTGYWAKVDKKHFATALDVVSDIFLHAMIAEKEVDRERGAIIQELNMYEDDPARHVWDLHELLLYGDQPLGWEIIGTKENLRAFTRKDLTRYFARHYVSTNTVIGIAGNFSHKDALRAIAAQFGAMRHGDAPTYAPIAERQSAPLLRAFVKKTDQTHLVVGVRAYDMFDRRRFALAVLSTILGGGMSSRLFISVRERRGLAYRVHTTTEAYHDTGYLATQCGVEQKNVEETLRIILKEYRAIARTKVGRKELRKAKDYLIGHLRMGLESTDDVVSYFVTQEVLKNHILSPDELARRIAAVTATDVHRVARDVFRSDRLACTLIGPRIDEKKIHSLLTVEK